MKSVSELSVGALVYSISSEEINLLAINDLGEKQIFCIGKPDELIAKIDSLHEEINDKMAIASGIVPNLNDFISNWGKKFLPPVNWFQNIDILIIIPFGDIHGLPIHAVHIEDLPLCARVGTTYSSSMSLFSRCVSRNPIRKLNLKQWDTEENSAISTVIPKRKVVAGGIDVLGNHHKEFIQLAEKIKLFFDENDIQYFKQLTRTAIKTIFRKETDVLWVATHGFVDLFNHYHSGLLVGEDDMGIMERNIPLHEGRAFWFRDLPLRAFPFKTDFHGKPAVMTTAEMLIEHPVALELVALIGCSTDARVMISGDEPVSIAESYLHLGASSVIGSLWDIDMSFAEEWTENFLHAWIRLNQPKALAFKWAINKLYKDKWMLHPEKYACLILKGDWL